MARVFRELGRPGETYPPWVLALRGRSGVYLVRSMKPGRELLYIGESHSGRLLETMTRHFQKWTRGGKSWWRGRQGERDPGTTYPRDLVEVAYELTPPSRAVDRETELIAALRPRDNVVLELDLPPGSAAAMDVPF